MPDKKNLRIGVTVNLENYENLRVEVEEELCGNCSPDELINYLDSVLGKFGNNDPDTKKRVESYRRRVIRQKTEDTTASDQTGKGEGEGTEKPAPPERPDNKDKIPEKRGIKPEPDLKEPVKPGDKEEDKNTPEMSQDKHLKGKTPDYSGESKDYPDKVQDSPEGIIHYNENSKTVKKTTLCEICGSAVTPQAEHASRVIDGRVLCRKCLDRIKK